LNLSWLVKWQKNHVESELVSDEEK
jgi:hypothetical protein